MTRQYAPLVRLALTFLLTPTCLALPAAAQVTAWGEGGGELFVVHLPVGAMNSVGPTGAPNMESLALVPDGRVLGLVDTGSAADIYEMNTDTGAATLLVSADQPGAVGLTVLDDGRVFLSVGQEVREVDTGTGTTSLLADLGFPVVDLADNGIDVIAWVADNFDGLLYSIDSTSGVASLLREVEYSYTIGLMAAPDGGLWYMTLGGGVLAPPVTRYVSHRIGDFGSGDLLEFGQFSYPSGSPQAQVKSLAFRGVEPIAEVPVTGAVGQLLMMLLIVAAGWLLLVRR